MPFYAVAKGRSTGIYHSWADCVAQVKGFSGAKFKKFDTESSAYEFIHSNSNIGGGSSSYNNYQSSASKNLKRTYSTSFKNNNNHGTQTSSWSNEDVVDSGSSGHDLKVTLNKQVGDLEKRLNDFSKRMDDLEKGVNNLSKRIDQITKSAPSGPQPHGGGEKSILIAPPQPKKYKRTDKTDFETDNEGYVQVYINGACTAIGRQSARAGLGVYWGKNHRLNRSEPVSGIPSNNRAYIQAATVAIKTAVNKGITKLTINSDSKFLIKAATAWIPGWKQRGWKWLNGVPVENEIDFKELDCVPCRDKVKIKWNHVQAQNGQHGNEMAIRLAKAGADLCNKRSIPIVSNLAAFHIYVFDGYYLDCVFTPSYNKLPMEIKELEGNKFKQALRTWLLNQCFYNISEYLNH